MSDVIAELRRLYAAVPQGEWTCEGPDFHGYRIFSADEKVLNHTLTETVETADLIVAMHEALPALLDAIEALRGLRRYPANTVSAEVYAMRLDAALAALGRSDDDAS